MVKILFVGGTFDKDGGRPSSMVNKFVRELENMTHNTEGQLHVKNGGNYDDLQSYLENAPKYDIIFWWANVPNDLPKVRNVKEYASHSMLITSKRNDGDKYTFMELTQKTLAAKANLTFEFKKDEASGKYHIMVFDPLGCQWYEGFDIPEAAKSAMYRLDYLRSITRQSTIQSDISNGLVLSWYFDRFKQPELPSDKKVPIPEEQEFVKMVKVYAEDFHRILNPGCHVERFLGNASLKMPPQVGRCSKGMPSFRDGDMVFVSQRNIDKQFIELENFVPVYMEDGKLYYCGEKKPSVDAPIQIRLYEKLPNIRYIIHAHCYIDGAPFTGKPIPCGAIEEVDEVIETLEREYGSLDKDRYLLNLKGHGSLLFAGNVEELTNVHYIGRTLPEKM